MATFSSFPSGLGFISLAAMKTLIAILLSGRRRYSYTYCGEEGGRSVIEKKTTHTSYEQRPFRMFFIEKLVFIVKLI